MHPRIFARIYCLIANKYIERKKYMNDARSSVGYLTVMVSTARGAIPLEGATVNIRNNDGESSEIIFSLLSDRDGKTPKVSLPTPPLENSEAPGISPAFSTYNIDVFKEGYIPLFFHKVPIFPSVISIQPAVMVPATSAPYEGNGENIQGYPQSSLS